MPGKYVTYQDYAYYNVRTAAILTNAYIAGNIVGNLTDFKSEGGVHLQNQLVLYFDFTIGSLTDLLIKIEFSPDNVTYYQETTSSISNGVSTDTATVHKFSATGKYRIALPIKDRFIRISANGEGTVTTSSLAINAAFGVS